MSHAEATVFLVDDDDSVRRAMSRLIRAAGHRVEAFPSAQAFLARTARAASPACLVLDIQMPPPGLDGMALQRALRERDAMLPIVFITGHGDIPQGVQAMKDGAVDFLPKPVQERDLLDAVARALARSARADAGAAELHLLEQRAALLTPRERQVMGLVVSGRLNKQIAAEFGTVEKTIKVHRAAVMRKMQADSLADLVRMAARLGIDPASG